MITRKLLPAACVTALATIGLCFALVQFAAAQEVPATLEEETSTESPPTAADLSPVQGTIPSDFSNVPPPALELAPPTSTAESPPMPAATNNAPLPVPPPQPDAAFQQQPQGDGASFAPGVPNLQDLALAIPEVEIWRQQSSSPQKPGLRHRRFELAYLVGAEPSLVRLWFHPLAAGQAVAIQPGPGVTVDPPDTEFRVESNGECVVSIALDGSFSRSEFNVYCCGVKTKVPLSRASQDVVEAREAAGRGR